MRRSKLIIALVGLLTTAALAQAGTFTFTPAADAKVVSTYPTTNYAGDTRVVVDASPATQSLIRFNVTNISGTVTSARVRLFVSDPSSDAAALYRTSSSWSE